MTVSRSPIPGIHPHHCFNTSLLTPPMPKATNLHHGARPRPTRPATERPATAVQHTRTRSRPDTARPDPARSPNRVEG